MNLKSLLARPFAGYINKQIERSRENAVADQERIWKELLAVLRNTEFGKDHHIQSVSNLQEFRQAFPSEIMKPSNLTFKR